MLLMDVNVLVYAHREDVDRHHDYRSWLESVINENTDYGYSALVLSRFLRVVTHPKIFAVPSPLEMALEFVGQLKNQTNAINITPRDRHWLIFDKLIQSAHATGNAIPDAYHAALAIESGCEWITTDKGFKKYQGLSSRHPLH